MEATQRPALFPPVQVERKERPVVFWNLAIFALRDFFRSPWIILHLLVLVGVQTLFFQYQSGQGHFFLVEYITTTILAAITAGVMLSRANRAETYPILARRVPRASFTGAIMLAAWLVAIVGYLLSSLAVYARFYGPWLSDAPVAPPWLVSIDFLDNTLPVAAAALTAVGLVALLSSFISPSGVRLGLLALLALLVMSFDSRNFPIEAVRPALDRFPPVLAPLAGALKYATENTPDAVATLSLGLLAGYAVVLVLLALWLSTRRELILD
ncbi:MAG TPA: hypothetical protein VEX13_15660 [Chloroflexia bacterium]|nr:hypothetical protein [Chloroflexia bacterium]